MSSELFLLRNPYAQAAPGRVGGWLILLWEHEIPNHQQLAWAVSREPDVFAARSLLPADAT